MQKLLALMLPIVIAALLAGFARPFQSSFFNLRVELEALEVQSAAELAREFRALDYHWPLQAGDVIPAVSVQTLPPDLSDVTDIQHKKGLFFRALLPIVLAENKVIEDLRLHVAELLTKGVPNLSSSELRWLTAVASHYKVVGDLQQKVVMQRLLRRLDVVPPELALAQAANESAWGTSRFARQGNNLFGQWTYQQSQGIVPLARPQGESYAVRTFSSIDASVRAYIHNLNTNKAYDQFRKMRQQMRNTGQVLDGDRLATGLLAYSARGKAYVDEIRAMMQSNQLSYRLEAVELAQE